MVDGEVTPSGEGGRTYMSRAWDAGIGIDMLCGAVYRLF